MSNKLLQKYTKLICKDDAEDLDGLSHDEDGEEAEGLKTTTKLFLL